jgi:hypothetical protein
MYYRNRGDGAMGTVWGASISVRYAARTPLADRSSDRILFSDLDSGTVCDSTRAA